MNDAVSTIQTPSRNAYARYVHAIKIAYRALNLVDRASTENLFIPAFEAFRGLSPQEQLKLATGALRKRLATIDARLHDQVYADPWLRKMSFRHKDAYIPIINDEGREWYENSPILNFDFYVEDFCGLHKNARVIYDIGGHQGVWALYYAMTVGVGGRVYTFEPSIINVETIIMSMLINNITNVIVIPFGIGDENKNIRPNEDGLLIAGVEHNVNIVRLDNIFWEKPDFVKIDIEGYEHELLLGIPDLFEFSTNMHLEIHVPHLDHRGVDYREMYRLIPFDRVRVRLFHQGALHDIGPDDTLTGYSTLLITPKIEPC